MLSSPTWAERKFMIKKPRNFNAAECMVWMYANNPKKIDIYMQGDYPRYLISHVPINQLKIPDYWHYSKDTMTIIKEFSSDIVYIVFK